MSRRSPKKYHLFLNWLRNSHKKFNNKPYISSMTDRCISMRLSGVTKDIVIMVYGNNVIDVNARTSSGNCELIASFMSWAKPSGNGFMSEWLDPKLNGYYAAKEDLYATECFEPLLAWCNEHLVVNGRIGVYRDNGGLIIPKLQMVDTPIMPWELLQLIKVTP